MERCKKCTIYAFFTLQFIPFYLYFQKLVIQNRQISKSDFLPHMDKTSSLQACRQVNINKESNIIQNNYIKNPELLFDKQVIFMSIAQNIEIPSFSMPQILNHVVQQQVQFGTNSVLKEEKDNHTIYYLPCYVRFKVKEITEINIESLQGTVFGTLLFTFFYGGLEQVILKQFVGNAKKSILLHFGRQQSIELKQEIKGVTYKPQHKRRMIDYVVRSSFTCRLEGDVFYTPFELINLFLNITIQSLPLDPEDNKNKRIQIKFNCMRSDQVIMLQHSLNKKFGNYHIANYFFDSQFKDSQRHIFKRLSVLSNRRQQQQKDNYEDQENEDDNDDDKDEQNQQKQLKGQHQNSFNTLKVTSFIKDTNADYQQLDSPFPKGIRKKQTGDADPPIKNFQYAHFRITMYKYPGVNLISIFVPLWILGLINLFIFFQERALANRIAGIATLTLAFIAFIPTINDTIPQTPNIKLVEILVYMQAAASVLCLIQSYQGRDSTEPYDWTTDGLFITALILNLLTIFIMLLLFIIHKCFWQKVYTRNINVGKKEKDWKRGHWKNLKCDAKFLPLMRLKKIEVL